MNEIDIENPDFYQFGVPAFIQKRTEERLTELKKMGMIEVGFAQFGVKGVVSGLYIEMVWSHNDEDWKSYIDWAKTVIAKK